ncbi:hypothetical protein A3H38_01005 [candidate division WOR-1 bacterium RIFCSPLOWO2_02_FULL_46_20]|uniref:Uncharacterized protein n=2 Tax=Saganbacteria TaxID=1703751 RepID=A0A1F4RDS1_UNCSA|nr:MAG: hypothetical protein A3H38_01005 [candidate division WOR-1 bacterium RIFCSPLOWO2_02_FULL_46_20]OGC08627.1 MAG: hypothetical protein A3F86_01150 [candidate division WOR-1 bacterium RIFCSPLOWO2_12_FULL_45_9]
MIPNLSGVPVAQALQKAGQASTLQQREQVKDEFLVIFYKELLKQAFAPPTFGVAEEKNSFGSLVGNDLMIEKLAMELAESRAFALENVLPALVERNMTVR